MATKVIDQETIDSDQEMADLLSTLKGDVSVTSLAETGDKKGADVWVECYHAFDGRAQSFPLYMVSGEGGAMSVLKYRFTKDQVEASGADPKWIGKQVWFSKVQPVERPIGTIMCRFHVNQTPDVAEANVKMGLSQFCRHETKFLNSPAEDFHVQRRHPRWYRYLKTFEAEATRRTAGAQTDALLAIAASLVKPEADKPPTK